MTMERHLEADVMTTALRLAGFAIALVGLVINLTFFLSSDADRYPMWMLLPVVAALILLLIVIRRRRREQHTLDSLSGSGPQ